jgi:hypothetical protein
MSLLHLLLAPSLIVVSLAAVTLALLTWLSRDSFAYARPFGISESESLMNFSPLGSLECICQPTDAATSAHDRRSSCRACGHAIVAHDPISLYQPLSRNEIRRITENLRRAGIDARKVAIPASVTNLSALHDGSTLASLAAH